jgi:hypothetical protein
VPAVGWWWALVVVVLLLGAAGLLGALAWGVVRRGLALAGDVGEAGARLGELAAQVEHLPTARPEPSVFDDPSRLRAERAERLRRARRARARARSRTRAASRPVG